MAEQTRKDDDGWRLSWLAQVAEDPIEPERPIVDPHHHFWRRTGRRANLPPYLLADLWADTGSGHRIEQTVFVQCHSEYRAEGPEELRPLGETEFVTEIALEAQKGPPCAARIGAIVGFADLTLGAAVEPVLHAHQELAQGLFRGIRHIGAFDPEGAAPSTGAEGIYDNPAFRDGFKRLEPLGMSFDAWNYHLQIPALTGLARAFPATPIVFDHFGGPIGVGSYAARRDEIFARWKTDVAALAKCPNVFAKLGGLAMPLNGARWQEGPRPATSDELVQWYRPFYDQMIEHFGPERCMFESNFPVDKVSASYNVVWNAFKKLAKPLTADEKEALFRGTAMRIYKLLPVGTA